MNSRPSAGDNPVLSIVTPTYNRRRYIQRSLEYHSVELASLPFTVEFIISDNASTDGSQEIYEGYAASTLFRFVHRERNSDAYANLMTGFHHARGRLVLFLGDDDYLIAEKLAEYVAIMLEQPDIAMLQAPWFMLDESKDNAIMGQFYYLEEPARFFKGEIAPAFQLILERHIFPEVAIYRRDPLMSIVELPYSQSFWAFVWLKRALTHGDVVFMTEPFARYTAISIGDTHHIGNQEVMIAWDTYRGGLEYALASVISDENMPQNLRGAFKFAVDQFVTSRMTVAVDLHVHARNWVIVYLLNQRLMFAGANKYNSEQMAWIGAMAGLQSAVQEAVRLGCGKITIADQIPHDLIHHLPQKEQAMLTRDIEGSEVIGPWKTAMIVLDRDWRNQEADNILTISLNECMRRYS